MRSKELDKSRILCCGLFWDGHCVEVCPRCGRDLWGIGVGLSVDNKVLGVLSEGHGKQSGFDEVGAEAS